MSRFVSGGTNDAPVERDDAWLKAQQEIEANRRRKEEEGRQEGGKTLYEVLQANKAAKQEAFEESIRLKNQFRSLDEDEVEFLDSVLESTRAQEAALRKETSEQLEAFRKQQEAAENVMVTETAIAAPEGEEEQWIVTGKKRKKGRDKEALKGVKLRKTSTSAEISAAAPKQNLATELVSAEIPTAAAPIPPDEGGAAAPRKDGPVESGNPNISISTSPISLSKTAIRAQGSPPPALGLGSYSSDED